LCVLGAIAQNPDLRNDRAYKRGLEFSLTYWKKRERIKYAGQDSKIGKGWEKLKYPYTDYRILKYLEILSGFIFIRKDHGMCEMMEMLIRKSDKLGRYYAESIHKDWSDFDLGQKKTPSRWITFLVYRILGRYIT